MQEKFAAPPSLQQIRVMAEEALETIPAELRRHVNGVVFHVQEFPDRQMELELGLASPFDLLGLYHGVPFGEKSVSDVGHDIDMIFLYRRPLLDYWAESSERLEDVVRHVLIHEIGHHFGFSDDDMERIEEDG